MQKLILVYEGLKLLLDTGKTALCELVVIEFYPSVDEMLEVSLFFGEEEEECLSGGVEAATGASHAVDVLLDIEGWVELHDPVHCWDIQSPCCHVRAQQHALLQLSELVEGSRSLLLLLLPVDVHHRDIHVIQQIREELHAIAGGEEHHSLFLALFLQEGEEQLELFVGFDHYEALLQTLHSRSRLLIIHTDVDGILEGKFSQFVDFLGLGGREEDGLAFLGQCFEDLGEVFLEALPKEGVGLVNDEREQVMVDELGVLQVVQ